MPSPQPELPPHTFTNSLDFSITRSYCDAFFLHQKYVVEGLTPAQIAAQTFSSKKTVLHWLRLQKIQVKPEDLAGSQTPYGFRRVHGRLTLHAQEQKTISRMADLKKQGYTYREIANVMNSLKVSGRKASGKWYLKTIYQILRRWNGSDLNSKKTKNPDVTEVKQNHRNC
jgi:hypothetical protein